MRAPTVPIVLAAVLLASGCGAASGEEAEDAAGVATSAPDARLTLVADEDPVASAASASRALFDRAELAELLTEAWRLRAPARLRTAFDAAAGP